MPRRAPETCCGRGDAVNLPAAPAKPRCRPQGAPHWRTGQGRPSTFLACGCSSVKAFAVDHLIPPPRAGQYVLRPGPWTVFRRQAQPGRCGSRHPAEWERCCRGQSCSRYRRPPPQVIEAQSPPVERSQAQQCCRWSIDPRRLQQGAGASSACAHRRLINEEPVFHESLRPQSSAVGPRAFLSLAGDAPCCLVPRRFAAPEIRNGRRR